MSFFIRKSLSTGPVRFNLSKGGIGLSAGITGARIGINKHGAYVAGGRHGLYYRERIKTRKGRGRSRSSSGGAQESVELFKDTGHTFSRPSASAETETTDAKPEKLRINIWVKFAASITLIAGLLNLSPAVLALSAIIFAGGYIDRNKRISTGEHAVNETQSALESLDEESKPEAKLIDLSKPSIAPPYRRDRDYLIGDAAATLLFDAHPSFGAEELDRVFAKLSLTESEKEEIKLRAFDELLDTCLADHIISEEEEMLLRQKAEELKLPEKVLASRLHQISRLASLRKYLEINEEPVSCPVNLTRGETCYYKTPAKMLKKKVIERFQRNNVKYAITGYDPDIEGTLYLTNKQLYLVHDGVRNVRLSHILDVTCSLEDDTVHLSLRNRVNPIILAVPDAMLLSTKIQYFISESS